MLDSVTENKNVSSYVLDYSFFTEPDSNRYSSSVTVYGLTPEDLEVISGGYSSPYSVIEKPVISSPQELRDYLNHYIRLWLKPYVVAVFRENALGESYAVLLDRGVMFRVRVLRAKYWSMVHNIKLRFKKLKGNKGKTTVLFETLTVPHDLPLDEAFRTLEKLKELRIKAYRRLYPDLEYIAVKEVHKDGYPHYHILLYRKRGYFKVFKYKGIWRFEYKRLIDKAVKKVKGYTDTFAFRSRSKVPRYLAKYLSKTLNLESLDLQDPEALEFKELGILVMRVFRSRVLTTSRFFTTVVAKPKVAKPKPSPKALEIKELADKRAKYLASLYKELQSIKHPSLTNILRKKRIIEKLNEYSDLIYISPNSTLMESASHDFLSFLYEYLRSYVVSEVVEPLGFVRVSPVEA